MLKYLSLIQGRFLLILEALLILTIIALHPGHAKAGSLSCIGGEPGDWCHDLERKVDRWEAERQHEELMDELQRPRQCFTNRDSFGRLSTTCY